MYKGSPFHLNPQGELSIYVENPFNYDEFCFN